MVDAVANVLGGTLMATFLLLIAVKLNELPLWIVILSGIALMIVAIWRDTLGPLLGRRAS